MLEINRNYMGIHSKDNKYVLSEWDIKNNKALGYIVKTAIEIYKLNPKSILVIGLGGGSILGELARLDINKNVSVVSVEIDSEMIKTYNKIKYLYLPQLNHSIVNCDFLNFKSKESFDVIFGDIPYFYDDIHISIETQINIVKCMIGHSHDGTVWILNVLNEVNMRKWLHIIKKMITILRPQIFCYKTHYLIKIKLFKK